MRYYTCNYLNQGTWMKVISIHYVYEKNCSDSEVFGKLTADMKVFEQ